MTAGTKIFLAIVAVLVAVLVVYYGFLMNGSEPTIVMDQPEEHSVEDTDEPAPPGPRVQPREERQRVLTPPREPAPEPEPEPEPDSEPEEPDDELDREQKPENETPLVDHSPVTVTPRALDDGGKDAPDVPADEEKVEEASEEKADDEPDQAEREESSEPQRERREPPEPPQYTDYTVRSGDTMSSIAADWFGDAGKWDLIAKANPFVDPNRLTVGEVLRLPPKDAEREAIEGGAGDRATVYVVRSGDNLTRIARAYYNDAGLWRLIYDANRETIGGDPGRLRVGMRLTIPPAPKPAEADEDDEDDD